MFDLTCKFERFKQILRCQNVMRKILGNIWVPGFPSKTIYWFYSLRSFPSPLLAHIWYILKKYAECQPFGRNSRRLRVQLIRISKYNLKISYYMYLIWRLLFYTFFFVLVESAKKLIFVLQSFLIFNKFVLIAYYGGKK